MRYASRTISLLLIIGLLVQVNYVAAYCVLFTLNRQSIAKKLCEKKTRTCCGKCFLNKKIAAAEEPPASRSESNTSNTPPSPKTPEALLAIAPSRIHPDLLPSTCSGSIHSLCCFPIDGYPRAVYQPPEIIPHISA